MVNLTPKSRTIIDIGASVGVFSKWAPLQSKNNRVIAIEPISDISNLIPKLDNIEVMNIAILPHHLINPNGKRIFKRMLNSELSTFQEVYPELNGEVWSDISKILVVQESIEVICKSLSDVINSIDAEIIDFVKIDTQGTDLLVFQSAGSNVHRIMSCVLEFPYTKADALYLDETSLIEGVLAMKELGFEPVRIVPNGAGEANVFFLNNRYSITDYFTLEVDLDFDNAPVLKIGDSTKSSPLNILRKFFILIIRKMLFKI